MNNWRWDNPHAFGDQIDRYNPPTTSSGKAKHTGEHSSWYGSDDPQAMIEPPSYRQCKPGHFLAVRPLNWVEIIDDDDHDANWAHAGAPCSEWSCHGHGNDNEDGTGEEGMQGVEKWTGQGKGMKDGKGKGTWKGKTTVEGKGKGKGNGKGKGMVIQTPGGDHISGAVDLQLQKEMYDADMDTEGELEQVYSEPEALPPMSISSVDGSDSTEELDGKYDSEHDSVVDIRMEDVVDSLYGVDLGGDVDMDMDDGDEEEDESEEVEEEED